MSSRLSEKAKLVAQGQKDTMAATEAMLDGFLAKQQAAKDKLADVGQKMAAVQADIDAGTAAIEDVVNQLTNS